MNNRDTLDCCENLFLTKLYEPRQNEFLIEVAVGKISEVKEAVFIGERNLGMGRRIYFDDSSDRYLIYFDSYISYLVLNESFEIGLEGIYSGNRIRNYQESAFIDFCKTQTSGFSLLNKNKISHFVIVTQNHIVNVLTISPMVITLCE